MPVMQTPAGPREITRSETLAAQALEHFLPEFGEDVSDHIRRAAEAGREAGVVLNLQPIKRRHRFSLRRAS